MWPIKLDKDREEEKVGLEWGTVLNLIDKSKDVWDEEELIESCAALFGNAIKERMIEKKAEGFTGWLYQGYGAQYIPTRLLHMAERAQHPERIELKTLVDIGAMAMILYNRKRKGA